MSKKNEHLWDGEGDKASEAFDEKMEEWEERDWMTWLKENLAFPFKVITEIWDTDYTDTEEPGFIAFQKRGDGELHFGCIQAVLDWRHDPDTDRVEFSFSGFDEGNEVTGRGWGKVNGKKMDGKMFFYQLSHNS